jgi:hypothetical protein
MYFVTENEKTGTVMSQPSTESSVTPMAPWKSGGVSPSKYVGGINSSGLFR